MFGQWMPGRRPSFPMRRLSVGQRGFLVRRRTMSVESTFGTHPRLCGKATCRGSRRKVICVWTLLYPSCERRQIRVSSPADPIRDRKRVVFPKSDPCTDRRIFCCCQWLCARKQRDYLCLPLQKARTGCRVAFWTKLAGSLFGHTLRSAGPMLTESTVNQTNTIRQQRWDLRRGLG